jgi:hypothetical protein
MIASLRSLLSRIPLGWRIVLGIGLAFLLLALVAGLYRHAAGLVAGLLMVLFGARKPESKPLPDPAHAANAERIVAQVQAEAIAREAEIQARRAEKPGGKVSAVEMLKRYGGK